MRVRSAGIVIKDGRVLLIHRKNTREYYVLPGGGVEEGETSADACLREIREEASIRASIVRPVLEIRWDEGTSHICYLCEYDSGSPKLGAGTNEARRIEDPFSGEFYEPMWVAVDSWKGLPIYPLEAKEAIGRFLKDGFPYEPLRLDLETFKKKYSL